MSEKNGNSVLAESKNGSYNEFFTVEEFTCKCGCGKNEMKKDFIDKLTYARMVANIPFNINSGFRCKEYQAYLYKIKVTKSLDSAHPDGTGADIEVISSWHRYKITNALKRAGFDRIGHSKKGKFIHVDCYEIKPKDIEWIY